MPAIQAQQAYDEIAAHIMKQGGAYRAWYCGIAASIESRLFGDHKVPRKDSWWSWRQCFNDAAARDVETALVRLGCDGGPGGGDATTVYVYAYLKGSATDP